MITTVRGDITSCDLKNILPHEYLLSDICSLVSPIEDEDFLKPLTLFNYGKVSRNPYAVLDNACICDMDVVTNIIPMMEDFGISVNDIDTIMTQNPIRFLERG